VSVVQGATQLVENVAASLDDVFTVEADEQRFRLRVREQSAHRRQCAEEVASHTGRLAQN